MHNCGGRGCEENNEGMVGSRETARKIIASEIHRVPKGLQFFSR